VRILLDTNIFLEVLLDQDRAAEVRHLLSKSEEHELFISDFSLHSIGLILFRHQQHHAFRRFLVDMFLKAGVFVVTLMPREMEAVIRAAQQFGLDFDDAYQYAIAEDYGLTIISFDADFDRTDAGRCTPDAVKP